MTDGSRAPTRRVFLTRAAGAAAALTVGGALPSALLAAAPAPARPGAPAAADWDMSWVERVTGAHRQLFDSPDVNDGAALHQARMWLAGFHEVYHTADKDMSGVLVFRHTAVSMVLNDAMYGKYPIGKSVKVRDPASGKDARRNPFLKSNVGENDQYALIWPDGGLDTLVARGLIVLACNMALHGMAGRTAKEAKRDAGDVYDEFKANLVPGVTLMPSGIFAVTRAQEAGCHFLFAG